MALLPLPDFGSEWTWEFGQKLKDHLEQLNHAWDNHCTYGGTDVGIEMWDHRIRLLDDTPDDIEFPPSSLGIDWNPWPALGDADFPAPAIWIAASDVTIQNARTVTWNASQDDYTWPACTLLQANVTATANLTGIKGTGQDGQLIELMNVGSNVLTLTHEDASSAATNRIYTPYGYPIKVPVGGVVALKYNLAATRWYPLWQYCCGGQVTVAGKTFQTAATVTWSAAVNNYTFPDGTYLEANVTSDMTLSGIVGASTPAGARYDGQAVEISNVGSAYLTLSHQDGNSSAANQISTPDGSSIVVPPGTFVILKYNLAVGYWWPVGPGVGQAGALIKTVVKTSGTSYVTGKTTHLLRLRMLGGGGGSGNAQATGTGQACASGGGSSGGYSEKLIAVTPNTTYTCAIGAGGTGGAAGGGNGGTGGDTTFTASGNTYTAKGGGGSGSATASGGYAITGGSTQTSGSTGDLTGNGECGKPGFVLNGNAMSWAGDGGNTFLGGGGRGSQGAGTAGTANTGGGGSGACQPLQSSGGVAGGAGGSGVLIVDEYS